MSSENSEHTGRVQEINLEASSITVGGKTYTVKPGLLAQATHFYPVGKWVTLEVNAQGQAVAIIGNELTRTPQIESVIESKKRRKI